LEAADWDAAIVNLGSNYRDDAAAYAAAFRRILDRLAPRPVVVVTVSEYEDRLAEVNYVIRDLTRDRPGVTVLEWSERTRADDTLTAGDGLHLSERGREVLAAELAELIGSARRTNGAGPEECLDLNPADGDETGASDEGD
jgi:lysophospholipase L1-like esterase